jgi:hypothetical protein
MVDCRQLSLGFTFILLLGTSVLAEQAQLSDGASPPAGKGGTGFADDRCQCRWLRRPGLRVQDA